MSTVKINMEGLKRFRSRLSDDIRGSSNGPVRAAFRQWAARYRAFIQERFHAKGNGSWRGLDKKTKNRKGRGGESAAILIDTGTILNAMRPTFGKPGGIQQDVPFGITVGYGTPARHPKGSATIADIAHFHHSGAGNLPVREIIVPPSAAVQRQMAEDMNRALIRLGEATKL